MIFFLIKVAKMTDEHSLRQLRKNMKSKLKEWIPDNKPLIKKEMKLFDKLMSRRDFMKTTSFAAAVALINHGCGSAEKNGPPSTWSEFENQPTLIGDIDGASTSKASKMVVDSDVMDTMRHFNPLSSNSAELKGNALLESFNPHILTVTSSTSLEDAGFNAITRNYGIPEIVHLSKKATDSDYKIKIYHKDNSSHHGLTENEFTLTGSAQSTYNTIVSANGNFHNQVKGSKAYSQKMIIAADWNQDISYSSLGEVKPLMLYFQQSSSELLAPGVESPTNLEWDAPIDLIAEFKNHIATDSEISFSETCNIVDVDSYNDGHNHNFLYGTIRFDDYYNYGFVVTFNSIDDLKPTVTFFTPKFLSKKSNSISSLVNSFSADDMITSIKSFALFSKQLFKPFAQVIDENKAGTKQVLFSFLTFDVTNATATSDDDSEYDLRLFESVDNNSNVKRYLISVETSVDQVTHLLPDYELKSTPSVTVTSDPSVILSFDTSNFGGHDIWSEVYDRDSQVMSGAFIRFIKNDGTSSLKIQLVTPHVTGGDNAELGVSHKNISFSYAKASDGSMYKNFKVSEVSTLKTSVEDAYCNPNPTDTTNPHEAPNSGDNYKKLWFTDMMSSSGNSDYSTLGDVANFSYQFFCSHNHQGQLRSYFVVTLNHDKTKPLNNLLVAFHEQGSDESVNATMINKEITFVSQDFEGLDAQIKAKRVPHHPAMILDVNVDSIHPWHKIGQDSEIFYTSHSNYMIKTETINGQDVKSIVANDGSNPASTYKHSVSDAVEGVWTQHEQEIKVEGQNNLTYRKENHQVHLHTNNAYNLPVALSADSFVELRFSKPLIVTDHTDPKSAKTYHTGRYTSLFMQTDSSGRIALEIDSGAHVDDKFDGAMMYYRFVNKNDVTHEEGTPIAVVTKSNDTGGFESCNISFKLYERLSAGNINSLQKGATSTDPNATPAVAPHDVFTSNLKESLKDTPNGTKAIDTFSSAFITVHDSAKPDNGAQISSARSMANNIDPLTFVPQLNAREGSLNRSFFDRVVHWISKAAEALKRAAQALARFAAKVAQEASALANKIANAMKDAVNALSKVVGDIASALTSAITAIGSALMAALKVVISIAKLVWNLIMALFDTGTAWRIGQEIRQIVHDQFTVAGSEGNSLSPDARNAYGFIATQTAALENDITKLSTTLSNDVHKAINAITGYTPLSDTNPEAKISNAQDDNIDTSRKGSNSHRENNQKNSTKLHYMHDQTKRTYAQLSPATNNAPMLSTASNNSTVEGIVADIFVNSVDDAITGIETAASNISTTVVDLISGQNIQADINKTLGGVVDAFITETDDILNGVVRIPQAILNGSELSSIINIGVNSALKGVFELLGLLLFFDKDKFKTLDDIVFFTFGYGINIIDVVIEGVLDIANIVHYDMRGYISNGYYRQDINKVIGNIVPSQSRSISRVLEDSEEPQEEHTENDALKFVNYAGIILGLATAGIQYLVDEYANGLGKGSGLESSSSKGYLFKALFSLPKIAHESVHGDNTILAIGSFIHSCSYVFRYYHESKPEVEGKALFKQVYILTLLTSRMIQIVGLLEKGVNTDEGKTDVAQEVIENIIGWTNMATAILETVELEAAHGSPTQETTKTLALASEAITIILELTSLVLEVPSLHHESNKSDEEQT